MSSISLFINPLIYLQYSKILFPVLSFKMAFISSSAWFLKFISFFIVSIISFKGDFILFIILSSISLEIYLSKQIFKIPESDFLSKISSSFSSLFSIKLVFIKHSFIIFSSSKALSSKSKSSSSSSSKLRTKFNVILSFNIDILFSVNLSPLYVKI